MNWPIRQRNGYTGVVTTVLVIMLCIYGSAVFLINFSGNPVLFCTDMYSDMILSAEIWEHKSFFPEGWVFGNQVYTVATPVIAAFFYGLTANHSIAMGVASCLMAIWVLVSFDWMLKTVVTEKAPRLVGSVTFISVVLFLGDAVDTVNGWQLFFTMCSYYACYAINAFLAFGCYLRSESIFSRKKIWIILLTCILSFGTGIQSMRQTVVMSVPLVGIELLCMALRLIRKERMITKATLVVTVITVFNIAGVILFKLLDITQVTIFGQMELVNSAAVVSSFVNAIQNIYSLFSVLYYFIDAQVLLLILLSVFALVTYWIIQKRTDEANLNALICYALLATSIAAILVIDIFTTMSVRNIYYFMIFPLMAVAAAYLFSRGGKMIRIAVMGVLIVVFLFCGNYRLPDAYHAATSNKRDGYEEVSAFLQEEGYSTIYAGWNLGEKIAIASDFDIQVGFWNSPSKAFIPIKYLCDPAVFHVNSCDCVYIFFGEDDMEIGLQIAKERGLQLELLSCFPESDIYVFTSKINIMKLDLQG